MRPALEKVSAAVFDLFFPDDCRICERPLTRVSRVPVCDSCLSAPQPLVAEFFCVSCRTPFLNAAPLDEEGRCALCRLGLLGFDSAHCYGAYEGTLRELIHLYKYAGVRPLAGPLGELLAQAIPRDLTVDAVVPVPLHWRRRLARGFNQSALLAGAVSKRYGLPVLNALRRKKPTAVQAGLSHAARRANVAGAFEVRRRRAVEGRRVLLIDDVLTTGATVSACAGALKRAGARHVSVLTLARVDRRAGMEPFRAGFIAVGAS